MEKASSSAWSVRRRLAVITGLWCYFAALLTLNNYVYATMMGRPSSWYEAARFPIINYTFWTLFTPLILLFCEHIKRYRWPSAVWVLANSLFGVFILLLNAALWIPFTQPYGDFAHVPRTSWHFLSLLFWQSIAWNLWMYWVIVGICYGLDYYFGERDARLRATALEGQLAKAELQVLKSQLQPHFLFNTLNLISSLIHSDVAKADDMIGDLGTLLRTSLENRATQEVPLAEELKAIDLYLNIQRLRFQDTLTVTKRISPDTLDVRVPHLILQPLVENAFRHGISKRVGAGLLDIEARCENGFLVVRIDDNGPGIRQSSTAGGIGLSNTRQRLDRLYGKQAALEVENTSSGFRAELRFPIARAHRPD